MVRARYAVPLIAALALAGCDRITGAGDQKILDAESVGYACRVSKKSPEDCMKENEAHSPTYLLNGWKSADRDINEKVLDPTMGVKAAPASSTVTSNPVAAAHSAPVATKVEGAKPATKPASKPDSEKPAKAPAQPGKAASDKKPIT